MDHNTIGTWVTDKPTPAFLIHYTVDNGVVIDAHFGGSCQFRAAMQTALKKRSGKDAEGGGRGAA